jgi:Anti-sigma-K factor rskA
MMTQLQSPHISDDLPRLLTGDATRDEVLAAAEHLRTCTDCQHELVSAVVAHASLTSAYRFAEQVVAPDRDVTPPEGPSTEPSGRHAADAAEESATEQEDTRSTPPLPDLSGLFAQVRADAGAEREPAQPAPPVEPPLAPAAPTAARQARPHRRRWVAAGLAAAVIAGGGITVAVVESNTSQPAGRSVALDAFGTGKQSAKLTISGNTLKIDASKLPEPAAASVYEVWLVDGAGKNLAAIGTLGTDRKATLTVTPQVRSNFKYVQVSVQKTDRLLPFSNVSVLRGDYS